MMVQAPAVEGLIVHILRQTEVSGVPAVLHQILLRVIEGVLPGCVHSLGQVLWLEKEPEVVIKGVGIVQGEVVPGEHAADRV